MNTPFSIIELSPYPYVLLDAISAPRSGLFVETPTCCTNKAQKSAMCRDFYAGVRADPSAHHAFRQCPHGFACFRFTLNGAPVAFTCLVPWPRLGGHAEKKAADQHKQTRVAQQRVIDASRNLTLAEQQRIALLTDEIKHFSSALHEIRKFNRTIKQEAERLSAKLDTLPKTLSEPMTRIWKSSELMSTQFDIMELIANEDIAKLERKTRTEVFRIVDKCVHIYEVEATKKGLSLSISGDSPRAVVCDKTFPIIPTVLIENAIRYSLRGTVIEVSVNSVAPDDCEIHVTNVARHIEHLPDIFKKGVRGTDDGTGHGLGLHLAQLVAEQHGASLKLDRKQLTADTDQYTFTLRMVAPPVPADTRRSK